MMRKLIKKLFKVYNIDDLVIGGHCGLCGKWIDNQIFSKYPRVGICPKCNLGKQK